VPDAFIALGSNLGDRREHLRFAARRLREEGCDIAAGSALYATAPVGIPGGGEFLNAVIAVRTALGPRRLLELCLRIEAEAGRKREGKPPPDFAAAAPAWTSRTLDLDLLGYGDLAVDEPGLVLPHPRLTGRPFVLAPLREVAPDWKVGGRSVSCWYDDVAKSGANRLDGTENWFWH
jgi:2-amino-4-hydroxy-6-hydroxymethyldihydropteridine diphosphokinase